MSNRVTIFVKREKSADHHRECGDGPLNFPDDHWLFTIYAEAHGEKTEEQTVQSCMLYEMEDAAQEIIAEALACSGHPAYERHDEELRDAAIEIASWMDALGDHWVSGHRTVSIDN